MIFPLKGDGQARPAANRRTLTGRTIIRLHRSLRKEAKPQFCLFGGDSSLKLLLVTLSDSKPISTPDSRNGLQIWLRILMAAFAFAQFSYITADPDLWGHLRFGQDIWEQGKVHATDPFSFTAQGYRWINHEWLMEVSLYLIYHLFDSTGLLVFKAALGILIVHLLSSLYFARHSNLTVYLVLFVLIIPVMAPGFMTRPHLATFLCLTLLVYVLQKFFDGNHRIIKWTPLIMLVWVNSHGGVVAGLGIFGTIAAIEFLRCLKTGEKQGTLLVKYFLLSCVAVLINPYGYNLWLFFVESLGKPRAISEWGPVTLTDASYWQYKVLVLLFIATFFMPQKKRIWEIAVIVLAVVYGFRHQRHTVLTAIMLAPYLLSHYGRWLQWDFKPYYDRLSNHFHWVTQGVLAMFFAWLAFTQWTVHGTNNFKIRVDPNVYPTYAAQFMEANQLEGNLVVPFDWGEYMIWKSPGSRVSIDGRFRTAYPEKIIELNRAFEHGLAEGLALLNDWPTILVLTKKNEPPHTLMEHTPGWQKIYQDPISKLFIRTRESAPDHPLWKRLIENQKKRNDGRGFARPNDPPPWEFPG